MKVKLNDIKMRFALDRHSDYSSFYQVFIANAYPNLLRLLKEGDTVIDAGANARVFTVIASLLVGDEGNVIAIEPEPENLIALRNNTVINGLKNVKVIDKALFSESNRIISMESNGTMSHIILDKTDTDTKLKYEVNTITFDDLVSDLGISPVALKMDIEGAEKFALQAADQTMKSIKYRLITLLCG